jgi:hypothetical protein
MGGRAGIVYVCAYVCMYSLIEWAHSNAEYRDVTEMQVAKLLYLNLKREGNTSICPYLSVRNTRFTATAKQKNLWHWSLDGDAVLWWMLNRHWLHGSYSFELLFLTHCFTVLWRKECWSFVVSVLSYLLFMIQWRFIASNIRQCVTRLRAFFDLLVFLVARFSLARFGHFYRLKLPWITRFFILRVDSKVPDDMPREIRNEWNCKRGTWENMQRSVFHTLR